MAKYRKKPVVFEAFQLGVDKIPDWFKSEVDEHRIVFKKSGHIFSPEQMRCTIKSLWLEEIANYGDYIVKAESGFIYHLKSKEFEEVYERVEE